ncbi:hypothetical protein SLEP1_g34915 [Rubroshorea leprosula]|uniref:Uncharacterized protein n=1 Tax=Rubroshorea leprosula TaxID=152421 RepID=A0AAV5KLY4_9ROSI|nr:hypothetical protein SLEP1_g34915 [Rubroshorea leprosula]
MIAVSIMAELLGEYSVALARVTERLLALRRAGLSFRGSSVSNFRFASSPVLNHPEQSSFLVYF